MEIDAQNHPPANYEWSIGEAVGLFFAFNIFSLFFGIVAVFGYDPQFAIDKKMPPGWILALASLASQLATLILIVIMAKVIFVGGFFRSVNWRCERPNARESVYFGILLAVINAVLMVFFAPENMEDIPLYQMVSTPIDLAVFAFYGVTVAPFVEETLFRGVVYSALSKKMKPAYAIVFSAMLFASLHIFQLGEFWFGAVEVCFLGILAGYVRFRSGGLRDAVICHAAYNSIIFILEIILRISGYSSSSSL